MHRSLNAGHLVPVRNLPRPSVVVRGARRPGPTRASSSSPGRTTAASCPRASSAPSTSSPATVPAGTPCTSCPATATWTCSSVRTRPWTPTRSSSRSWPDERSCERFCVRPCLVLYGSSLRAAGLAFRLAPSPVPRRQRREAGRHALVDGIPFVMPVNSGARRPDGRVPYRRRRRGGETARGRAAPVAAGRRPRPAPRHGPQLPEHRHRTLHRVLPRHRVHPRRPPGAAAAARSAPRQVRHRPLRPRPAGVDARSRSRAARHLGHAEAPSPLSFEVTDQRVAAQYDSDGLLAAGWRSTGRRSARFRFGRRGRLRAVPRPADAVHLYFTGDAYVAVGRARPAAWCSGTRRRSGSCTPRHGRVPLFTAFLPRSAGCSTTTWSRGSSPRTVVSVSGPKGWRASSTSGCRRSGRRRRLRRSDSRHTLG